CRELRVELGNRARIGFRACGSSADLAFDSADIDLAASDVEVARVERDRFGEPGDRMLGRRVGDRAAPRYLCGDRAVVDDPTAARRLMLHDAYGFLNAQEHAGEIRIDHRSPDVER